ncbi:NXPE family member 3-like [Diadema setosum]|uniref:NXPE family member 3-like n=1 Tax=Diadema setosum TaxID=31175 RepID=UPI003B3B6767
MQCADFAWTCTNSGWAESRLLPIVTASVTWLFSSVQKKPIKAKEANKVKVSDKPAGNASASGCLNSQLLPCRVGLRSGSSSAAAGYFKGEQWFSNVCRLRSFNADDANRCLRNKVVYFHGDSTMRQYYEYLIAKMPSTLKPNPPTKQSNWKVGPSMAESRTYNFSIHYRHHGYPIRNNWTRASEVMYIADALDNLVATPDTVFVFTIWAHLTATNLSYYEDRVVGIRRAVERLHARSPHTLVLIKTANTRSHGNAMQSFISSDWYARELDMKLRETFRNYDKVAFIDQWSMALGYSSSDHIHPGPEIIEAGVSTLLSYMCPVDSTSTTGTQDKLGTDDVLNDW